MLASAPGLPDFNPQPITDYTFGIPAAVKCICVLFMVFGWMSFTSVVQAQDVEQPEVAKGIVWTAPEDTDEALDNLRRFREAGVDAVRTPVLQRDTLFALADSLELFFYQDLSANHWSTRQLRDSLDVLQAEIEEAASSIDSYASAGFLGLAVNSDLSTNRACEPLSQLAEAARAQMGEVRLYYVTQFVEHNPCANAVDLILLDVRDEDHPSEVAAQWRDQSPDDPAYGIGALGRWSDPDATSGLHHPRSLESQARYLEDHLPEFLTTVNASETEVVFVYRWNGRHQMSDGMVPGTTSPRLYALWDGEATTPAWDVVRGMYTGEQTVFAFKAGDGPQQAVNWLVIMAWLVVIVLGVYYLASARLRRMVRRYFGSRSFYRDAVREGRNVLMGPSVLLLLANGVSVGIIVIALAVTMQEAKLIAPLMAQMQPDMAGQLTNLLSQPVIAILLIAASYAALLFVWAGVMSLLSTRGFPLGLDQVLMLVAWPRWLVIPLMLAAVPLSTAAPERAVLYLSIIAAAWMLTVIYALFRTLVDYTQLAQVGGGAFVGMLLISPAFLFVIFATFFLLEYRADVVFIWHLATRS